LITLSAAAGYGKTSALIDFAHTTSTLPICWYILDIFDQDQWVFLDYLIASIEHRFPGSTNQTAALLKDSNGLSFIKVVANLARDVYTIGCDFIVIIDDWHLVDHLADIGEVIGHLLFRCPNCHFILASRSYPSLSNITLLAARRQMISIDEQQLRFTASEVARVFDAGYDTSLSVDQASKLVEQSNGWITGIILSHEATALPEHIPWPLSITGDRQVYQFLAEQVLNQQPPAVYTFLLDSALLEELTPERCDTIFMRNDALPMLERLLRHHLFITEIKPGVLRYHSLFREFLQKHYQTVAPERYHTTALRVAVAYAAQGQWPLAFDSYIIAGDHAAAQDIVAIGGEQLYSSGRLETLERWFAALPPQDLSAPLMCLKARVLLDRGHINEARTLADLAESHATPDEELLVLMLQAQLARIAGRYEQALKLAYQVQQRTHDPAQHATALRTIGICHHRLHQTAAAIEELNQALQIQRECGNLHTVAKLQIDLGICHRDIGLLQTAEDYYTYADTYWASVNNLGLRALCLNGKGVVQHLAGRYQDAHATLIAALQFAREALVSDYLAAVLSSLGDLYCDLQLWERAKAMYSDARQFPSSAHLISCLNLADVRLLIRQRQYTAAAQALRQLPEPTRSRYVNDILLLHGSIACGMRCYDQAAHVAEQAIAASEQSGSLMNLTRAYLLRAQIAAATMPNDPSVLIVALEQITRIADELNHDVFLVAETLCTPGLIRRAAATGWKPAADWLHRQQHMLVAAQMIDQDDSRPVMAVQTLGVDQILLNGQPIQLGWFKAREVFYYLLAHPDGATIDRLCEVIWPALPGERSRETLRTAIYQLRSSLPRDLIVLQGRQVYQINRNIVRLDYDVERFLKILDAHPDDPEAILEAIDRYHGLYLACADNQWYISQRSYLEQRYLRALHTAATHYEALGAHIDALTLYERVLLVDKLDEASHVGIMRCQIALNKRAAAISQYHLLRRLLDDELGLDLGSSSEAEQLYRQILAES
jgi:ATP/maltotriose-dependent transcriptional regulator MalT/DNA-binding SARP family transcriptional activator